MCVCVFRAGRGELTSGGHMVVQMCASHVCLRMCVFSVCTHQRLASLLMDGIRPPPQRRAESGTLACEAPLLASPSYKNLNMETVIGNCLDNLKWFIPGLRCSSQIKAEET